MPDTSLTIYRSRRGFSLVELLIVLAVAAVLTAIAVPQLITQRRLLRSSAIPREVVTKLRYARQLAIATRQSVTFQYDDATKEISLYNHHNNGPVSAQFPVACSLNMGGRAILGAAGYPNTACATPDGFTDHATPPKPYPLIQGGLSLTEITYGIPSGAPTTMLGDTIVMTPLVAGKLNITFQADGTVVDAAGLPLDRALYFFNNLTPLATASAVSVVGASGRAKIWRYSLGVNNFVE